jgi:hypothetical protein
MAFTKEQWLAHITAAWQATHTEEQSAHVVAWQAYQALREVMLAGQASGLAFEAKLAAYDLGLQARQLTDAALDLKLRPAVRLATVSEGDWLSCEREIIRRRAKAKADWQLRETTLAAWKRSPLGRKVLGKRQAEQERHYQALQAAKRRSVRPSVERAGIARRRASGAALWPSEQSAA